MIAKHSFSIHGPGRHQSSVSLEDPFWDALNVIAIDRGISLHALINEIRERHRFSPNLSSSIRVYVLRWFQKRSRYKRTIQ